MSHPAWKRSLAIKAMRMRRAVSRKAIAKRLHVSVAVLMHWERVERRK
jgi:DNA-binding transcriptional regulator YiaG